MTVPVVLASGSARRLELLRRIGIEPQVVRPDVDEAPRCGETPAETVARLAATKARSVDAPAGALVVAADTEVVLDGEVLGKPVDRTHAMAMLRSLSGRDHLVLTGVHVRAGEREAGAVEQTVVRFRTLAHEEVVAYVDGPEPYDKAGGYGIQGAGGMFVARIDGSDTNVVGLPLATLTDLASEVGVRLLPG